MLRKATFLLSSLRITGLGVGVAIKYPTQPFSPAEPHPSRVLEGEAVLSSSSTPGAGGEGDGGSSSGRETPELE